MNKERVVYGHNSNHICGGAMELILENQETCLTRSGFEPSINHTRGEHANHYTTDVVQKTSNGYYGKAGNMERRKF
jgi:hypothetical protein